MTSLLWAALLLAILIAAARLIYVASQTETGYETLATLWKRSFFGTSREEALHTCLPHEQAEYWVAEVDRIMGERELTPEETFGAAMVLEAPAARWIPPQPWDAEFRDSRENFSATCGERFVALAERLTAGDDGSSVNKWRLLAEGVMTSPNFYSPVYEPRISDWREMLRECQGRDPENALYGYLAAYYLWRKAITLDYVDPDTENCVLGDRAQIVDQKAFNEGLAWFEDAQLLPLVAYYDRWNPSALPFLNRSRLSQSERLYVAASLVAPNLDSDSRIGLFYSLHQLQQARAGSAEAEGRPRRSFQILEQSLRAWDQLSIGDPRFRHELYFRRSSASLAWSSYEFAAKYPSQFSGLELQSLRIQASEEMTDQKVCASAYIASRWPAVVSALKGGIVTAYCAAALHTALLTSCTGIALAMISWFGLRRVTELPCAFWPVSQVPFWILSASIAFAIFGMVPAEVIDPSTQKRVIEWTIIATVILLIGVVSWPILKWWRRRKFRYSLTVCSVAVVLAGAILASPLASLHLVTLFLDLFTPQSNPGTPYVFPTWQVGLDDSLFLSDGLRLDAGGQWSFAAVQFHMHRGLLWTVCIALLLMSAYLLIRPRWLLRESIIRYWTHDAGARWSGLARNLAHASLLLAVVLLLLHLLTAPYAVLAIEQKYQRNLAELSGGQATQSQQALLKDIADIRKDKIEMARITAQVEKQLAELEGQYADRETPQEDDAR